MATTEERAHSEATRYVDVPTRRVTAENEIEYAYRELGEGEVPLVLLQHFRGNLDNWDPALIDALGADRRVVTFDNVGVGATSGRTPNTVEAMAHDAIALIDRHSFRDRLRLVDRADRSGGRPHSAEQGATAQRFRTAVLAVLALMAWVPLTPYKLDLVFDWLHIGVATVLFCSGLAFGGWLVLRLDDRPTRFLYAIESGAGVAILTARARDPRLHDPERARLPAGGLRAHRPWHSTTRPAFVACGPGSIQRVVLTPMSLGAVEHGTKASSPDSPSSIERVSVTGQMGLGRSGPQGGLEEPGPCLADPDRHVGELASLLGNVRLRDRVGHSLSPSRSIRASRAAPCAVGAGNASGARLRGSAELVYRTPCSRQFRRTIRAIAG